MLRYKVYIVVVLLLLLNTQHYINPCCIKLGNSQQCNKTQTSNCCDVDTSSSCCETSNTEDSEQCCICSEDNNNSINYTVSEQKIVFYKHFLSNVVLPSIKKTTLSPHQSILPPKNILQQSSILLC